ncbi:COG1470 family protein [Actinokineospora sp.]|uniref:COG1470 family protein n=1 Tax=Actinokineospora sp. TaxID=1872133 RepID=UPI0040382D6D
MAVSAMLRSTAVTVAAGGAARCHVLIRNNSAVVDQFVFTVRGDVDDWTEVKPGRVNLMPHQEVTVELTFAPPRTSEVLAGEHPFALQVASREDPAGSVVQEGMVTVEPFTDVDAGIVPVTSYTRRKGRHTLAVDNLGNHQHGVEVTATDPDNRLTFKIRPHAPRLEPGTATFVRVLARPKKYFWKGPNRILPFQVKVIVPASEPIEIDAALDQSPLIPRRFFWLFSILLALLLLIVVIVTTLLRQRPVSIAGPAPTATPTSTPSSSSVPPSSTPVPSTAGSPSGAARAAGATGAGGADNSSGGGGGGAGSAVNTTFTIRAQAFPGVGGGPQLFSYVVPPGPRHRVTSVVLRNPAADVGQVQIRHGTRVLATVDLADVDRDGTDALVFRPTQAPLVAPGELVTLAVTCGNARDACTPSGVFTAALVR